MNAPTRLHSHDQVPSAWLPVEGVAEGCRVIATDRIPLGGPWHAPPDFLLWRAGEVQDGSAHIINDKTVAAWSAAGAKLAPARTWQGQKAMPAWKYMGSWSALRRLLHAAKLTLPMPMQGSESGMLSSGLPDGAFMVTGAGVLVGEGAAAFVEQDVDGKPSARRVRAALGGWWLTATANCPCARVHDTSVTVLRGVYRLRARVTGEVEQDVISPIGTEETTQFKGGARSVAVLTTCVSIPWTPADGDPRKALDAQPGRRLHRRRRALVDLSVATPCPRASGWQRSRRKLIAAPHDRETRRNHLLHGGRGPHAADTEKDFMDTLTRQWRILTMLPVGPRRICTATILEKLHSHYNVQTTQRTVQRDLWALSGVFPIANDGHTKPYGWFWLPGSGYMANFPDEVRARVREVQALTPTRVAA